MTNDGSNWVGINLANRYTVEEKLGAGGMGTVFRATDHNLETDVVVKVPHRSMLQDEEFVRRFAQEVRSLVTLSHPHVVSVLDVGAHDGVPFAVMRYLPGGDLKDRFPRDAAGKRLPQSPEALAVWLEAVAKALDFIHARGYVHRDIKPDNILFDNVQNAYVGDFGIVKALGEGFQKSQTSSLTQEGVALGTPEYMAPEVVMGEKYDGRADQYALAATVYEMLCGRPPFRGATPAAIVVKSTTEKAPDPAKLVPSIPRKLADCLLKGLSRQPKDRFDTCIEFAGEVLQLLRAEDRRTIRTQSDEPAARRMANDPDVPTDRHETGNKKAAVATADGSVAADPTRAATPPPLTIRQKDAECPSCGHRFTATSASLLSCPKCAHRFPPPGDSGATTPPPLPNKDTDRRPTETLKQSPPPDPPKKKRKTPKPEAAQPQAAQKASIGSPGTKKGKGAAKRRRSKSRSSQPQLNDAKPDRTPTVRESMDDLEPPMVPPGQMPEPPAKKPKPKPKSTPAKQPARIKDPKPHDRVTPAAASSSGGAGRVVKTALKISIILLMVGLTAWLVVYLLRTRDIVVAADGSGDYATIGEAIDNAEPGTRIRVKPGRYREQGITLDKPLTIEGDDEAEVRVHVTSSVLITDPDVVLKNLTIVGKADGSVDKPAAREKNGEAPRRPKRVRGNGDDAVFDPLAALGIEAPSNRAAIRITAGTPTIQNCIITSEDGSGIVIEGAGTKPNITRCRVHHCHVAGLHFTGKAAGQVSDCKLEVNRVAGTLIDDGSPELKGCEFSGAQHVGVSIGKGSPVLEDCRLRDVRSNAEVIREYLRKQRKKDPKSKPQTLASAGIFAAKGTDITIRGCHIEQCGHVGIRVLGKALVERVTVENLEKRGLQADPDAKVIVRQSKVAGCKEYGVLVFGKATIGEKCDFSGGTKNVVYIHKTGVAELAETTVRDSEGIGILCFGTSTLNNVTIRASKHQQLYVKDSGTAKLTNCKVLDGKNVGVYAEGEVTLSAGEVSGNAGGGISALAKTTISGVKVARNGVAGLFIKPEVTATIRDSQFVNGTGTGVTCAGRATMSGCTIKQNAKDGIYVEDDGNLTMRAKSRSEKNKGRGAKCEGVLIADDCDFLNNRISGISVYGGTGRIKNCRIISNGAYAVYVTQQTTKRGTENSFVTLQKCVMRGHRTPTYKRSGSTLLIDGKSR